jgi:hypothetical protein
MTSLERVILRQGVPRVLAETLPAHVVFGFAALQVDAVVSWPGVARQIAALPATLSLVVLSLSAVGWAAVVRRGLGEPAWLGRQPLPHWRRGLLVMLPGVAALGPIFALSALWPGRFWFALGVSALTAAMAAVPALLPWSIFGIAAGMSSPWLMPPVVALALPIAGHLLDGRVEVQRQPRRVLLAKGPISALVSRDLLCLVRSHPWAAVGLLFQSIPAFGAEKGVQLHGDSSAVRAAAVVLLAAAVPAVAAALGSTARSLGHRFDPPEWPISARSRATALGGSAVLCLAPVSLAVFAASGSVAAWVAGLAAATGIAWVIASDRRGVDGRAAWWSIAVGVTGLSLGIPGLFALTAVASGATVRALSTGRR